MTDYQTIDPSVFANPDAQPPSPPVTEEGATPGGLDWADIGKGAAGGFGRGVTGLAGTAVMAHPLVAPLAVMNVGSRVARNALDALGVPEDKLPPVMGLSPAVPGQVAQKVVESATGPFYQPHTVPGQYASTAAEFAPAGLLPGGGSLGTRALNTIIPAVTTETAGQLTSGHPIEPYARGTAGLLTGLIAGRAANAPTARTAQRQADVDVLNRELGQGNISAGELTQSKPLQWIETVAQDMPFSAKPAAARLERRNTALDRAVTERTFDRTALGPGANVPQPGVYDRGIRSLGTEYDRLGQYGIQPHALPQLGTDLGTVGNTYNRATSAMASQRSPQVDRARNDITDALIANRGTLPGDVYKATRSDLGTRAKELQKTDVNLSTALRGTRNALDEAMRRSLPPGEAEALALNDRRYANMKSIEGAVANPTPEGHLSPARLASSVKSGRQGQYARGTGDLDELAGAASRVFKELPSSGTGQRLSYQNAFNPVKLVTGLGMSWAISPSGQQYLATRTQNNRDNMARFLTQQASSQPSGLAREDQANADFEDALAQQYRDAGLEPPPPTRPPRARITVRPQPQ